MLFLIPLAAEGIAALFGGGAAAAAGTAAVVGTEAAIGTAAAVGTAAVATEAAAVAAGTTAAVGGTAASAGLLASVGLWGSRLIAPARWAFSALRSGGLVRGGKIGLEAAEKVATSGGARTALTKVGLAGGGAALGATGATATWAASTAITLSIFAGIALAVAIGGFALYRAFASPSDVSESTMREKPRDIPQPAMQVPQQQVMMQPQQQQPVIMMQAPQPQGYWVQRVATPQIQQQSFAAAEDQRRQQAALAQNVVQ
ncbi:MAG: hypothetical protein U1E36_05740 [Rickettsiales bacterium]